MPITTEAAEFAIEKRWKDFIEDVIPLPTQYDNSEEIDPPANASYARLSIFGGETPQVAIGGDTGIYRTLGLVVAEILVPIGTGSPPVRRIIDTVKTTFRGVKVDGVTYTRVSSEQVGKSDARYQVNVNIDYRFDEV